MAVPDRRRSLSQSYSSMMKGEEDVPSDEEAQDSATRKERLLILGTPSRRRSRSLHSALPERILTRPHASHSKLPTLSLTGYESEPSDLSCASSEDGILPQNDPIPRRCQEDDTSPEILTLRRCHRQWPFRLILLACAYVAWISDSWNSDSFLVKKRNIPTAAFSSQHGREVPIQPMEQHSPLRGISRKTYIPPSSFEKKKRRPQVAHALPARNPPPILGQRMERFVMDENEGDEILTTTPTPHSHLYYLGYVALVFLCLETGIREVRRRCVSFSPRQRLRNE